MKKSFSIILLVIGGFIVSIFICEIGARLFYPRRKDQYMPDIMGFYTLKPGWEGVATASGKPFRIKINKHGLRGSEIENKDKPFLLCLGDSFTFGIGVNDKETYPAVLGEILEDRFQVLNGGVTGYNLSQSLGRLMMLGQQLKPAIVVLAVFANDWEDLDYTSYIVANDGNLVIAPRSMRASDFLRGEINSSWEDVRKTKTTPVTEWLSKWSRAFELIYFRLFYYKMNKLSDKEKNGVSPGDWQRLGMLTRKLLRGEWEERTIRIFNHGCDFIERMKILTESWNGKLLLVYIPFYEELENPGLALLRSKLYEYLESKKIEYLDLVAIFKTQGASKIYIPGDGHLSVFGNKVTAHAIAQKVMSE